MDNAKLIEQMASLLNNAKDIQKSAKNGLLFCQEIMTNANLTEEQKAQIKAESDKITSNLKELENVNNNWK
jgi:DNA-binding helix-hairpin-helix protein with protein kinase domain